MLRSFASSKAERYGLIFKVFFWPNSMVLTQSGLELAKHIPHLLPPPTIKVNHDPGWVVKEGIGITVWIYAYY